MWNIYNQQVHSLLKKIWIIGECIGIVFISTYLLIGAAAISKTISPSPWVWILLRVGTCMCIFLMYIRVTNAYMHKKWKYPYKGKYVFVLILGAIAFLAAFNQDNWFIAFPLLLVNCILLFSVEVSQRNENLTANEKPAVKSGYKLTRKPEAKWSSDQYKKVRNTHICPTQKVIFCHCTTDKRWFKQTNDVLKPLERAGILEIWDESKILPGTIRNEEIEYAFRSAAIVIVLVSINFFASDYIARCQLPQLLHHAKCGGSIIFPLIVDSCLYDESPLGHFQAFNPSSTSKPLDAMGVPERKRLLVEMARAVFNRIAV